MSSLPEGAVRSCDPGPPACCLEMRTFLRNERLLVDCSLRFPAFGQCLSPSQSPAAALCLRPGSEDMSDFHAVTASTRRVYLSLMLLAG